MRSNRFLPSLFVMALAAIGASGRPVALPASAPLLGDQAAKSKGADEFGRTPLMLAALRGDAATAQALLAQGAGVDAKDRNGMTALMWAASGVADLLLERGADIRARDVVGRTALSYAAYVGDAAGVTCLLAHGSEVDARDSYGWTPLFLALARPVRGLPEATVLNALAGARLPGGGKRADVVSLLLDRGAKVSARDYAGRTPLLLYSERRKGLLMGEERLPVKYLLAGGADVNAQDCQGNTALMWRVRCGDTGVVELLLEHGADVNATRRDGATARSMAARRIYLGWPGLGDPFAVQALIEAAASARGPKGAKLP